MDLISTVGKRDIFSTPGGGIYSPLSTALFFVLLQSGSQGLSVCEALRKLVGQGYSKLLNSDMRMRAVQVKSALRGCPAFKELESRKFVLRFNTQDEHRNSHILLCKSKNHHGKKQGNASSGEKGLDVGGSSDGPTASPERGPCVESPFNQPTIVPDKGLQMVGSGDQETSSNIGPSKMSVKELLSLESFYSDHSNQSMRGDGGESIFSLQRKDEHDSSRRIIDHYLKDNSKLNRCRRTDGKRWQCSKQVQLGSIYCEHHHIVRQKGRKKAKVVDAFGRVVRAAARTRFPPSITPSESFVDKHVIKEEEVLQLEPLMNLAIMSACVSEAQSEGLSVEEAIPEVQEETKPHLHMLDLEDVQRSKKKPRVAGHGQSVVVKGAVHEGPKETKPDAHVSCEVEGERKPYPHESEVHDLEDVQRLTMAPKQSGPGQSVLLEKAIHEGQERTKTDVHVPEFNGSDHMQGVDEILMSKGHGQSEVQKKVLEIDSSFEDATVTHKGKGLQAELLGPKEKLQVAAKMPCLFLEDFKKRLLDLGNSSSEGQVPLHALNRCVGPEEGTDVPTQCHRHNGKGWQCSRPCKPGYMYCEHHQGRDSKRTRSSKRKRKVFLQLELDKQVLATCLKGNSDMQVLRVAIDVPQSLVKGLKAKVEGSKDCQEGTLRILERCHRKDGKGWQCAQQCKLGSIYCDRHQRGHHKRRISSDSQQKLALLPDNILTEHVSDMHVDMKQPSQCAVDMALEQTETKVQGQRVENENCRQDEIGVQSSPVATPAVTDLNACYLGEKNTTSGKAEANVKWCHRRDGKKWQCSRPCMPGYNHCEHHQGRGRSVKFKT